MERGFNAGQRHSSIPISIFNRLRVIARYWSEIATFSYPLAFNALVGSVSIGIPGKTLIHTPQKTRIMELRFRSAIAKIRTCRIKQYAQTKTNTITLTLTLTDTGDAVPVLTLMLGYRSLYITIMAIAAICDSGLSPGLQALKTVWRYVEPFRHNISVWRTDGQTINKTHFGLPSIAYTNNVRCSMTDAR